MKNDLKELFDEIVKKNDVKVLLRFSELFGWEFSKEDIAMLEREITKFNAPDEWVTFLIKVKKWNYNIDDKLFLKILETNNTHVVKKLFPPNSCFKSAKSSAISMIFDVLLKHAKHQNHIISMLDDFSMFMSHDDKVKVMHHLLKLYEKVDV